MIRVYDTKTYGLDGGFEEHLPWNKSLGGEHGVVSSRELVMPRGT